MTIMEASIFTQSTPRADAWRELNDLPDDSLVERARDHDLAAFEALMRRHNRRLFRVTRGVLRDSDDAQDAVQEAYLRAFTRLETYQPTGKFPAWLTRIALNEALMMRRRTPAGTVSLDEVGEESWSSKRPPPRMRRQPISSWKPRMRARCSNMPSTRCRKISAWCS